MTIHTTYTQARAGLAKLLDEVTENREIVIIQRRDKSNVAMITEDELASLIETAHLLRSPENARRLLTALNRALENSTSPSTIDDLRREVGLGDQNS